ncbi:MAG: MBL fold metallo-hydrolase [Clostridia bacterium]|nr:MBL fold metallo-hydrolase [Clostridia bacterium]
MKKTYVTTMPDQVGAFLKASKCFAELGINITRTSYNKAIDSHTFFIEAEGTGEQLKAADEELKRIGYIQGGSSVPRVLLIELQLKDVPGSVTKILELILSYSFNISYISSHQNDTGYQFLKVGLLSDDDNKIKTFLDEAAKLCTVRVIDYNTRERNYDNSIFYNSFADGLAKLAGLPDKARDELVINTNLAMQAIDERGDSPFMTFDCIRQFTEHIAAYRKDAFVPRITWHTVSPKTDLVVIEPPCGSNTMILKSGKEYLFIDTGYACYGVEMQKIFRRIFPDFDDGSKKALITHADVDHCGLLPLFSTIYMSRESFESLSSEFGHKRGLRENNPEHEPYVHICKLITSYIPPNPNTARIISELPENADSPVTETGALDFGDMHFTVFQGLGGHLPGEIILADFENKIAFTGDIFINLRGLTPEQEQYNRYAPTLMSTVDTDRILAAKERAWIKKTFSAGDWRVFGSHGAMCKM